MHIEIYDTTLRDGAQGEGVSFSLEDKVLIARRLDSLGFDYVEGGFPLSNPKDAEFFQRLAVEPLKHSKLCAFGMTRRRGMKPGDDPGIKALLDANTPVVTIVGKTHDFHVTDVLGVSLDENLAMIRETIAFLREVGRDVVYDAEHFFDGWKANAEYAAKTVRTAAEAGASRVVMCDTNGGSMPEEVAAIAKEAATIVVAPLGIHCHNDCELAVANSLAAVDAGAIHVQGTINGIGERCGNADLISVIANLSLKKSGKAYWLSKQGRGAKSRKSYRVLQRDGRRAKPTKALTGLARYVYEIANLHSRVNQPFVGASAFAHKGGMHVHAVAKAAHSYEHIRPSEVGNSRRVLISELSGRSNIVARAEQLRLKQDPTLMSAVLKDVVRLEHQGYQFEAAEASFDLLLMKALGAWKPSFDLVQYDVHVEGRDGAPVTKALVKLRVMSDQSGGELNEYFEGAEGDGPVNALDAALRKALGKAFPKLKNMQLVDFKVRVINGEEGSAARVRVMIESKDKRRGRSNAVWTTIGVHENVIEASKVALIDSFEYMLCKEKATKGPGNSSPEELAAFDRWWALQTHENGTRKTRDKALSAAINEALQALLQSQEATVDSADILSWISNHLGFGVSILKAKRIDMHCEYETGAESFGNRRFPQPKSVASLRPVRPGVYALASGTNRFTYEVRSHANR